MSKSKVIRISSVATRSCHDKSVVVDTDLINAKARDARESDRKRDIHVFHSGDQDPLQRMLNAIQPGSYITPHRHNNPPKSESIVLLQGMLGYASFDDDGAPQEADSILLDAKKGMYGLDVRPRVWHTIFALAPDTVVFEVKPGPYDPPPDKGFAPWAPPENSPAAARYLMELEDRFRSFWKLPPRSWGGV
ncbi:MAG: WbuC family cupin fold metalloprotein [Planctomycetota bacterium]|jgi:cupin fold WbuC family metalloprotein